MSFEATKNLPGARLLVKAIEMELHAVADCCNPGFHKPGSGMNRQQRDRVALLTVRRESLTHNLTAAMEACQTLEEASRRELDSVDNLEMRAVLTFRYIHNMTWSEIARAVGADVTADAVKKRFERGLKSYEERQIRVGYTQAEQEALHWLEETLKQSEKADSH